MRSGFQKAQFFAQKRHVGLDVVLFDRGAGSPDSVDDGRLRHGFPRVGYEHAGEREFLRGKVDGRRLARELALIEVERDAVGFDGLEFDVAATPRERSQVRHELGGREGLGHIVVGARIEPANLVGNRVARREHEHGGGNAFATHVGHDFEAVFL